MVLIHRWSLYVGSITWKVYPLGPVKCGLYKHVVFMYRFRSGLTVYRFMNIFIKCCCVMFCTCDDASITV